MDNPLFIRGEVDFKRLRETAVETNKEWADLLGINPSTAICCTKPSGTVSQLVDSSSGLHARHSAYYIRSVRADNKDPLTQFLKDAGIPNEPEALKPDQTTVFYFPIKSPEGSVTRNDLSAIQQLEYWLKVQDEFCEHKPSVTVSVREHEWPEVGGWVYKNFNEVSGISFLPHSDHSYRQAPYQECSEEEYLKMKERMPKELRWEDLSYYEKEDTTTGMSTLACSADGCEVVDIGQ